jgi:Ca2+-binding RTX toxin-like protein
VNEGDDAIPPGYVPGNNNNYGAPGSVVDADPRLISNLVVDQTPGNPAAIAAALRAAGHTGDLTAKINSIREPYLLLNAVELATTSLANWTAALPQLQGMVGARAAALVQAQAAFDANPGTATQTALTAATTALATAQTNLANAQTAFGTAQNALAVANAAATGAQAAFELALANLEVAMDGKSILIPNISPDEGLSAPYNSWFTLFGQFFDHGLDLVKKGGNGTVYVPLSPDDPLYNPASPHTNFMVLTRVSTGDSAANVTTPWVDQNQTYTSHASHQVFLREYVLVDGKPLATGRLLEGDQPHTLATWADVKAQSRDLLGIDLTDADVGMVPMVRTDPYGRFIPDANGYAQLILGVGADGVPNTADDIVISQSTNGGVPVNASTTYVVDGVTYNGAVRLPNAFLDDIAHSAAPIMDANGNLLPDADNALGYSGSVNTRGQQTQYDNELLDAHYITGDGRGNENIGLTAVHFVFHSEHNRQIEQIKQTVLASNDPAFIAQWLIPGANMADGISPTEWNGERLFQAARFATEMQYQHLVFEEFARKIQPDVDLFVVQPDVELNPAIFAEFANVVYRFGHSMLNETVDRTYADGTRGNIDLFEAFLNPLAFGSVAGVTQAQMAGAIALGMTAQRGNEIDEFVTDVLRNQLVGIPLDLAAINIARGRDTGMPTLNQARAQFMDFANGDTLLRPYTSWADFAANLNHPESIINFIAAYGTHTSIVAANGIEAMRTAAMNLVFGAAGETQAQRDDRLDFLNARNAYATPLLGGLANVDLWVGGLAEKAMAFGGMLGSTFSFIFQLQMENLQDSDRFYYLSRVQGLNLLTELENNSLSKIIMRNTNLGEEGLTLPADVFSVPDHTFYVDLAMQLRMTGLADPLHDNPILQAISALVQRVDPNGNPGNYDAFFQYNGLDHIVIQGTDGDDHIIAGGGDDTVWGGKGNDRIEAGYGVDSINGGEGDDIITSAGTDIGAVSVLKGESGNDVIVDGTGISLIFGGSGKDYLVSGADDGEIRAGRDDDFVFGGDGFNMLFGNEGDDWIEGGGGFDYIAGDNGELFFNSTVIGHDVLNGGAGDTDYDGDSGDDIMFGGAGIQKFIGMWGHDWVTHQGQASGVDADMRVNIFTTLPLEVLRDRFSQVEALSGWQGNDILRGDDRTGAGPEGGTTVDPTPETGMRYNELNQAAIDRIAGLGAIITPDLMTDGQYWADGSWEGGRTGTSEKIFVGGNIILGGGGSDVIEGRGGDDVIDGDRYLHVRIKIVADRNNPNSAEIASVTSMEDSVTLNGVTKKLTSWMIDGAINPGQLHIVREILSDSSGIDTAVYWDVYENYEITSNAHGGLTIRHVTQTAGAIDPVTGRNRVSDGVDQLYNIELLQFADRTVPTANLINSPATGAPRIIDPTPTNGLVSPTEGQQLTSSRADIVDANGLPAANNAYSYQWQRSDNGGTTWVDIAPLLGGTGTSFTPSALQVGNILRLRISYTDNAGHAEVLYSTPTQIVGDNWNAIPFLSNTFNGTNGDDIANGTSGILGAGANDTFTGNGGNDILNGAGGTDTAVWAGPASNFNFGLNGAGNLIVTDMTGVDGTDTLNSIEQLRFAGSTYTLVNGTAAGQTLNGGTGGSVNRADVLLGHAGADTLNGNGGNDILVGGAGNDTINGGAGNDLILWRVGDGRDFIDGGANTDTVHIAGDSSAETYRIYSRAAAIAAGITGLNANTEIIITRNGTNNASIIAELDNIEEIVINGMGGGDTFIPIGTFVGTSLLTSTITLDGSAGDDTVDISALASAHRIVFRSNGGNDTILGTLRAQDVIELPPGSDPADYAASETDGVITLTNGAHSVSFVAGAEMPEIVAAGGWTANDGEDEDEDDHGHGEDDNEDDDHGDDDEDDCGTDDDDDDGVTAPPPAPGAGQPIMGTTGDDMLMGTSGNDLIFGLAGTDYIMAGAGNDVIRGEGGNDFIDAGAGRDIVFAGDGDDDVFGGDDDDMLYGEAGNDRIFGGDGNDLIDGGMGNDTLFGGAGDDLFIGRIGDGDDIIDGGEGIDTLDLGALTQAVRVDLGTGIGGRGSVSGIQSGNDTLCGIENVTTGSGNDTIIASNAVNVMNGGAGNDTFVFGSAAAADGDTILGFETGDKIDLSGIDGNSGLVGKQSLTLVNGTQATAPGQVVVTHETREDGEYTVVSGNTGGDNQPEFRISIAGSHNLTASDFTF